VDHLARKISPAKWEPKTHLARHEISADAITACLRTSGDTLSWWRCTDDKSEVAQVALALVTGMAKLDTIHVIAIPERTLLGEQLQMRETEGNTPIEDLKSRHVDLVNLDLERLSAVARILAVRVRSRTLLLTFTRTDLVALVTQAVQAGRVSADQLCAELQQKLTSV